MLLLRAALLPLLYFLWFGCAQAETNALLKLDVHIDAGVIKVGDLWSNAGSKKDTVVGPAPLPGRSISIPATQLAYIARLYDVTWRPISGVERTVLERAGRPLSREEMAEPIRRSLVDAGAGPSATVEFGIFESIQVPPASFPQILVEGIAFDPEADQFSAQVAISTDGMETQRMRLAGKVLRMVNAVVAARRMQPGDIIGPADVRMGQVAERRLAGPAVNDIELAVGRSPRRALVVGQALNSADIGPPVMIAKGDTVVVFLDTPNIHLAAQNLALASGGRDDVIQVMNPLSHAIVAARVTGPGRAMIVPGSTPLVSPISATPRSPEIAN